MFHGTGIYHVGQSFWGLSNFCELAKFSNVQYMSFVCHFLTILFVKYVSIKVVSILISTGHIHSNSCNGFFVVCSNNIPNTFHFEKGNLFVKSAAYVCGKKPAV